MYYLFGYGCPANKVTEWESEVFGWSRIPKITRNRNRIFYPTPTLEVHLNHFIHCTPKLRILTRACGNGTVSFEIFMETEFFFTLLITAIGGNSSVVKCLPLNWKVACSIHDHWVNCRSAPWARAFTSTAPARSTIQASACRQLPSSNWVFLLCTKISIDC